MLEKFKGLGANVAGRANEAVEGIASTVKGGVESLAQGASSVGDTLNEKAVRASTAKLCSILEIAMAEVRSRPLGAEPVALTATVSFGLAALEMQVQVQPQGAAGTPTSPVPSDKPADTGA